MNPTNLFSNLISTLNRKKFKCIILQLPDEIFLTSSKKKYQEKLKEIEKLSKILFNSLSDNGILWIFVNDVYHNGMLKKTSFDISQILSCSSFLIRNMIIWYGQHKKYSRDLTDFYSTIIFAVKNNNYDFNLDPVRESHIWKDFEWGGGRRSRYNPKGKNPSNLWLKTHSEKGKIKYHIPLSTEMAFERCLLLSDIDKESSLIFSFKKYSKLDKKFTKSISWLNIPKFEIESVKQQIVSKKLNQKKISHAVHNKIINKSSECMKEIENDMVQLIVTSPPYWGLRDYNSKNQIGYKDTYQEYLVRLQLVWKECFRVLRESGTLWVNIGKRLINDNMLLIANDIINSASEVGFTLKDIVIWHKPVFVPTSGKNNLTDRYEHVLFFAKNKKKYYFDKEKLQNIDDYLENADHVKNIWRIHRRIGNIGKKIKIVKSGNTIEHTAVYPDELVKRIILSNSKPQDLVLDPFAGSGTTLSTANKLNRKWIGYEINKEYNQLIHWRLKSDSL